MGKRWAVLVIMAAILTACNQNEPPVPKVTDAGDPAAESLRFDPQRLAHGETLYQENCAQCHGPRAQGHPDWQTPTDGQFAAAPPLDGTGNDWKRSKQQLTLAIKNGVRRKDGTIIMPGWRGRLSNRDMEDIIIWFQSLWPPEIYKDWQNAETQATSKAPQS